MSRKTQAVEYFSDGTFKGYVSARKKNKPKGSGSPHIPNKQEAKELRRLMQKSGESAEAVRSKLTNRRRLADAQKSATKRTNGGTREEVLYKRLRRQAAHILDVPVWHKSVDAKVEELQKKRRTW